MDKPYSNNLVFIVIFKEDIYENNVQKNIEPDMRNSITYLKNMCYLFEFFTKIP